MEQKKIDWEEATLSDLKMFSAQVLGITVPNNIGESTLRAKIRQAYNGESITIMVQPDELDETLKDAPQAPTDEDDGRALRGSSSAGDPVVNITIAEVEGPGGKRPVFVSVNGVAMLVPRGRPVDIPWRYYHAFTHAIKTVHEQDPDTHEISSSDVPSYPMSVNKMPPQHELDRYLAKEQSAAA